MFPTDMPVNSCASCSLGTSTSTLRKSSAGYSRTGAGFSTIRAPMERPVSAAATIASIGTSPWVRTTSTAPSDVRWSVTAPGSTALFAPGITMIRFSPVASTSMRAVPEVPDACAMPRASMFSRRTTSSNQSPDPSSPTAPIM